MQLPDLVPTPPRVTPRAFARLAEIGAPLLRVAVDGGGCSGFQYRFELAEAPAGDDLVLGAEAVSGVGPVGGPGPRVAIDPVSLPFLAGAVIDFSEELIGARFTVANPNATSSCGCGTRFSV
jgi:iron-sulfur cluster assembly accessory protein